MQTSQLVQYFNGGYKAHTHSHGKHGDIKIYIVLLKEEQ